MTVSGCSSAGAADADGDAEEPATDAVADARAAIDERGDTLRDEHVERALDRLDATGELTPEKRRAVEALAERLTAALLAPSRDGLREAAAGDDEAVAVALALFGAAE
ncbi:MAG: hypothetical protein ABEJ31_11240 [Haloarculaceae archaeon]